MIESRKATLKELELVLDWTASEGWNPGLDDAEVFFSTDPAGFFVATEHETPIAAISVVNHNEAFAFLGLYLVLPEHRGRGIGLRLWNHAVDHAGSRTIGLDGVPEQQKNYETSGFSHAGGTTRYTGRVAPSVSSDLRAAAAADIPKLIQAETAASGTRKEAYLSGWFRDTATRKTIILESGQNITGFCTVRQCRDGAKIGPLLAHTDADAERLIRHAAHLFEGGVSIDVPDSSAELAQLCKRMSLTPGFQTARMYRGGFVVQPQNFFAVATLELG